MVDTGSSQQSQGIRPDAFRENLRRLDRRQWWLWSSTVLVLILLTVAVASFAFPAMLSIEQQTYSFYLNQSVRALVGIVLLFAVYLVYQQMMIIKIRNQISDQMHSLTKVENLTNEVYKLAALDQLTGLYNRRSGEQRLAEEISRAVRHERPLTVLLMDLDGLKQINDRLGHAAGDIVLKGFAERLQRAIRGSDLAVRLGGDEFMVLLPECRADEVRHVVGSCRRTRSPLRRREDCVPILPRVDRLPPWRDFRRAVEASRRGSLLQQASGQASVAEFGACHYRAVAALKPPAVPS